MMGCSSVRYVQFIWLGIGMMLTYAARANLSVAIVSMTDVNITSPGETIYLTTAQKGSLLAAFFYGYVTSCVLYSIIAYHLSPSIVLGASGIICGLATLTFPYASFHLGYVMSFICRVVLGLCEGPFYPCFAALISNWAPRNERSRINSFICSGSPLGQALMMASSGALSASSAGWPACFYIPGACLLVWGLVTIFIIVDSPEKHKSISVEEKLYIESGRKYNSESNRSVPWLEILRCKPFLALLVNGMAFTWGYWTLQTMVPTYLKGVQHFDITKNGIISSVLNLSTFIMSIVFPYMEHALKTLINMTLTTQRKIWSSVALYGCGIIMMILAFFNVSSFVAVALLIGGGGLNAAVSIGFMCCYLDMSPNFAGVTACFLSGIMNITSVAAPTIAGLIIQDESSVAEWQKVFITSGLIFIGGNTIFLIFGSSEEQKWNVVSKEGEEK